MTSTIKTTVTDASVTNFINAVPDETKRRDGFALLEIFRAITGEEPKMWGTSIIGFGSYHYKSERSRQEGDWPLVGFSPRKQSLSLYVMHGPDSHAELLKKLGKHKAAIGCLYINKLADVDMAVLKKIIVQAFGFMKKKYSQ